MENLKKRLVGQNVRIYIDVIDDPDAWFDVQVIDFVTSDGVINAVADVLAVGAQVHAPHVGGIELFALDASTSIRSIPAEGGPYR